MTGRAYRNCWFWMAGLALAGSSVCCGINLISWAEQQNQTRRIKAAATIDELKAVMGRTPDSEEALDFMSSPPMCRSRWWSPTLVVDANWFEETGAIRKTQVVEWTYWDRIKHFFSQLVDL